MEKLLTIKQLSEILGYSCRTIYEWTHYGFIPYIKLGGLVHFKESNIDLWLKKRERKGRDAYKLKFI